MKSTFTISKKQFTIYLLSFLSFSATLFAQTATVTTNKLDYTPGQTVIITGTNWQPGETVKLTLVETPLIHPEEYLYAVADSAGNIYNNEYVIQLHDIGQSFTLTATGITSGYSAQTFFTDSFGVGVAPIIPPSGGFNIDGTLHANTMAGDWLQGTGLGGYVLNADGSVPAANAGVTFHLVDKYGEAENNFAGGLKVNDDPNTMTWVTNTTSNKTDMNNGLMHFSKDANGHQWVVVAADRLSNNGTAYIDFEFLQNTLDITGSTSGGFTSEGPDGGRTVNDFVLTLLLTQGGSAAGFFINRWESTGSGYDYIDRTASIPIGSVFAAVNTADGTPVSFGAFGNTTYEKNTFSEAAIDLTALLGAIDPCTSLGIKTIFIKTKVSSSSSAGIADFITPLQVSLRLGVADAGVDQALCSTGASTNFNLIGTANPSPGDAILSAVWSVSSGSATIINPNSLTTAVAQVTSGSATIILTVTTQKGCVVTDKVELRVTESNITCLISGVDIVCPKSITTYSAPANGLNYKWTINGNATISGADNQQNVSISAGSACSESYTLSLKITDANGCITNCEKIVKVEDKAVPIIQSCPPSIKLASNSNCEAVVPDFTAYIAATDSCTAAESLIITQSPVAGSVVAAGTTKVILSVKDSCNNEATCETNLIVTNYIVANDDIGTAVNGSIGGTAYANVLANDFLNCQAVNIADVNLSFVSSTNSGVTLSDSSVMVAAGTPAGSYSLTYQICEKSNPTNCDTAVVSVEVTAASIVANDDAGNPINGLNGGTTVTDVLVNDTLNGAAILASQVNTTFVSSTNAGITLSGTSVLVAAETPAGTYSLIYSICEKLNPTNCDQATVTVTVTAASIVATDDIGNAVNGLNGGTAVTNVLINDTLNGAAVLESQVNTTFISSTNTGITLSGTTVLVAAGTPAGTYSLIYKICEVLNPTNCDQATVTVTVNAATIVANDDTGSLINGFTGGTAVTNVLSNDTLNGSPVLASEITTSFVSSTNAGITLSGTSVLVAAGTPSGSYSLIYSICEILNPTNCDTATVTVTVNAATIVANDDIGNAVNGLSGGTAFTNVLVNDTLNGAAVLAEQVNTTFISSTNTGITLSGLNVMVAPGTPNGTYSLIYKICEKLNPTNCDTATVTVIVNAATIIANDDNGTPVNGYAGGTAVSNVLTNDTLNGQPVLVSQVNTSFISSTSDGITLNGTTVVVAAGTPAGTYSLIYKICEILNPTNCDTATVNVTVNAATIIANDDIGSTVNGLNGGTAVTNVLVNDTLNGTAILAEQVNTTFVSSTNAGITLNGTAVLVAAGTPAGTYSLIYKICEILNPTNCDQATVSVTVSAATIIANDDTGSPVNGFTGGTAVSNVLINDTLNGVAVLAEQVNTTFVSSTNAGITLNGSAVLVAAGTPAGTYSLIYKICEILNATNCDTATVTVTVNAATIIANDDTGDAVNGFIGGTALANVLINDTLNGIAVLASQVNTLFVSSTNAGITLSGTSVVVAAGTPFGSYSLIYNICEKLNTANCDQATVTVNVYAPSINLLKDGNYVDSLAPAGVSVGDIINYTFTVTNSIGSSALTNVTVKDPLVTVVGGPIASFGSGAVDTTTFSATYSITQADIDAGQVNNLATVYGTPISGPEVNNTSSDPTPCIICTPVPDCPNCTSTALTQNPKIALVKTASISGTGAVGDVITYTFTVTNTGNVTITNIVITDPLVGLTISNSPILSLAPGATNNTITGIYTITQADKDAGKITNSALAVGKDPKGNDISDISGTTIDNDTPTVTPITQNPSIALVKTASVGGTGAVGDVITYTFAVTNTGNVTITNLVITDPLVGLIIANSPIATLAPGATNNTVTGTYTITQTDKDAGKVTNSALAVGQNPNGGEVKDTSGTAIDNDTPTVTVISQTASIALVKTASVGGTGAVGEIITYTFAVTNTGNVTITNIVITDPLVGLIIANSPIATLAPGATNNSVTGTYTITQADKDAGKVTNSALAVGQDPNGGEVKDTSGTTVENDTPTVTPITQNPSIALVKTASVGGTGAVGDVITYTFAVTNTGNVIITNIVITDPLIGLIIANSPIPGLAPGATNNTVTGSYTITQADKDAGKVTNSALAVGQNPNGGEVKDTSGTALDNDTPTVTLISQTASIALVKTASVGGTGAVGDVITYTFAVTNTGNVTITNIVITDPLVGLIIANSPIATLAPGATNNSVTGTYTITQADKDAGKVTNSALAVGQDPNGGEVKDTSGTTAENDTPTVTPISQTASIALVKTASVGGTGAVGDVITYTFAVTNTGNVTVTNIVITDPLIGLIIANSPIATLAPGATNNSVTGSYTITQADKDAGKVTNSALAVGQNPNGGEVKDTSGTALDNDTPTVTPISQTASIALVKTATVGGTGAVGDVITYTFAVTNTGNVTITNIVITDPLVGLIIANSPIATLAPGATNNSVTGTYTITQADKDAGKVTNSALAVGQDPNGGEVKDTSGTTVENDTPTVTPITQNPSIALVKTASVGGTGAVGDVITYTFAVTNTGNVIVTNIVITDPLIGLIIANSPIATLAPGATNNTITGTYTITQADVDAGKVTNSALAVGQNPNGGEVKDTSGTALDNDTPTVTPLTQTPGLEVIKTSSTPYYSSVGDIVNYTIQVKNTGNVTLYQIVVQDPLTGLDEIIESLSPGSIQEYTQNYTVTQEDRINGSVTNTATATGKDPDGNSISDQDTVVVEAQIVLGCGTVTVHNAFSPNGDGINEVFTIDNIDDTLCYPENTVSIYNRWGVLVYETSGYNNNDKAFRGVSEGRSTISQSSGLPTGTYFYI
ncbi:gliding motility-associated C-terminal domain-containing protein, partial [Flavobacterium caseinilyticum]